MTARQPHQWLLVVLPKPKESFDSLPSSNKQAIFRCLQQLLEADNPYQLTFVDMLQDSKYERARRFRVGDYRVLFAIETEAVEHQKHRYQGTLFVLKIGDRKNVY